MRFVRLTSEGRPSARRPGLESQRQSNGARGRHWFQPHRQHRIIPTPQATERDRSAARSGSDHPTTPRAQRESPILARASLRAKDWSRGAHQHQRSGIGPQTALEAITQPPLAHSAKVPSSPELPCGRRTGPAEPTQGHLAPIGSDPFCVNMWDRPLWRPLWRSGGQSRYRCSHSKIVACQRRLFCGLSTQWPSSGKYSSRLGTPWRCRAVKSANPWPTGTR